MVNTNFILLSTVRLSSTWKIVIEWIFAYSKRNVKCKVVCVCMEVYNVQPFIRFHVAVKLHLHASAWPCVCYCVDKHKHTLVLKKSLYFLNGLKSMLTKSFGNNQWRIKTIVMSAQTHMYTCIHAKGTECSPINKLHTKRKALVQEALTVLNWNEYILFWNKYIAQKDKDQGCKKRFLIHLVIICQKGGFPLAYTPTP
jgi:hypothetical protein